MLLPEARAADWAGVNKEKHDPAHRLAADLLFNPQAAGDTLDQQLVLIKDRWEKYLKVKSMRFDYFNI